MAQRKKLNRNGAVIYRGPSVLDGAPIVVVVTGLEEVSDNGKTGDMLQTWILPAGEKPHHAIRSGADASVCGQCVHRRTLKCDACGFSGFPEDHADSGAACGLCGSRKLKATRSCYVRMQAPPSVFAAVQRDSYPVVTDPRAIAHLAAGRKARFGSYGDPAAVPFEVWGALRIGAARRGNTGYTHQRSHPNFDARVLSVCMVSADRLADVTPDARAFYVRPKGAPLPRGFAQCPAAEEAGRRATCDACGLCGGTSVKARSVSIMAHGSGARYVSDRS